MADQTLFEVDASQILAKLHLAGLQSVSIPNGDEFLVNTGIIDDDPKAKPDNPGKVKFDLNNKTGEYEVGYVTIIEYHKSYGLEDSLDTLAELLAKISGDESKLLGDGKDEEKSKQYEEAKSRVEELMGFEFDEKQEKELIANPKKSIDELKKQVKKSADDDSKAYEEEVNSKKDYCAKQLATYLKTFAGSDNVESFGSEQLGMVNISDKVKDSNDKALVKMYEIQPIGKQEQDKMVAQFRANAEKDPNKKNCKQKVCFKVKYSLNVDK